MIAVASVIQFHPCVTAAPGAYVGVDVFFAISGVLITGILLHAAETEQFSMTAFYECSILHSFPALFAVLVASAAAALIGLRRLSHLD